MKILLLSIVLVLAGCTPPAPPAPPTPFSTGAKIEPIQGCLMLRQEAEEYNRANPTAPAKTADC